MAKGQKESKIEEKVQQLVEWNNKYPDAQVWYSKTPVEKLKKYSNSEEEYEKLLEEYKKMQKHYDYVRIRRSRGKLDPELETQCKEGNVRGVFGNPTQIEEYAKEYRISEEKIVYIIGEYGTMEDFIKAYREGKLTKKDIEKLGANLRKSLDTNFRKNNQYDLLIQDILENKTSYIQEGNLNLYSSKGLDIAIATLEPREQKLLIKRYGLDDGTGKSVKVAASGYNISRQRAMNIINRTIAKLRENARRRLFILDVNDIIAESEMKEVTEICDTVFESNSIFYPDEEFTDIKNDIDKKMLLTQVENIRGKHQIKEKEDKKRKIRKRVNQEYKWNQEIKKKWKVASVINTNIDFGADIKVLSLSIRTFNALKRNGINTVGEVALLSKEELAKVKYLGEKCRIELIHKLGEKGLIIKDVTFMEHPEKIPEETSKQVSKQEKVEAEISETELEVLSREKAELEEYAKDLEEQARQAKELLASYNKLLGDVIENKENKMEDK